MPTDTDPASGAGVREERPTLRPEDAEAVPEMPKDTRMAEPASSAEPAQPAKPGNRQEEGEPEVKPAEQPEERPLEERVPLDTQPKQDGGEAAEPKPKAKPDPKPSLLDRFRGFFGRTPPSPPQDSAGVGVSWPFILTLFTAKGQ